jgi:hypothetical protein
MLIAVVFAGCADNPEPKSITVDNQTLVGYQFTETYDLTEGLDEKWSFEAQDGATVKARFYSVGLDSLAPGTFCFKADTPTVTTTNQCNEGNVNMQISPAIVTGKSYYDDTSGPGTYVFSATTRLGAGEFFVEINVTYQ